MKSCAVPMNLLLEGPTPKPQPVKIPLLSPPRKVQHGWREDKALLLRVHHSLTLTVNDLCNLPQHLFLPTFSEWWFRDPFQFGSVQSLSHVQLSATPRIAACQASLSITNFQSSLRLTSIESMMPSSHLILGRPLLLLPPIPPSIRVFSSESTLHMRWPKYWSFSFSVIPSKEIPGLVSFRRDWMDLLIRIL